MTDVPDDAPEAAAPADAAGDEWTVAELAALWRCSTRTVELLAKEGVTVRLRRGRYAGNLSTGNYIEHLRKQAAGQLGKDPAKDPVAANIRKKSAETELIELRLEKERDRLLDADDVALTWDHITRGVRQWALGLPTRIVMVCPQLTNFDSETIRQIVREGLTDLAMGRGLLISKAGGGEVQLQVNGKANGHDHANGATVNGAAGNGETTQ